MTAPSAPEVASGQVTQEQGLSAAAGRSGQVWSRRRPIGFPNAISTTGGTAAPLLAGFSLTTVVQIVLLLYALQFSALSLGYVATPQQRLEYFPESSISDKALAKVRMDQWSEMWLRAAYSKRHLQKSVGCFNVLIG